ncbi:MAG: hypothetical protein FJY74_01895 [Candidatus Eisenbacteria bacterium]|nr:hypothetical protein [Candidatus Eisenbacteria bacterium]
MRGEGSLAPRIEHYSFGRVTIDGKIYTADVVVLPGRVIAGWWRKDGHRLAPEDVEDVLAARPACLVIGTGASGLMEVPPETTALLEGRGISVIVKPTAEAVETYNRLRGDGRTAACLHLTC